MDFQSLGRTQYYNYESIFDPIGNQLVIYRDGTSGSYSSYKIATANKSSSTEYLYTTVIDIHESPNNDGYSVTLNIINNFRYVYRTISCW